MVMLLVSMNWNSSGPFIKENRKYMLQGMSRFNNGKLDMSWSELTKLQSSYREVEMKMFRARFDATMVVIEEPKAWP